MEELVRPWLGLSAPSDLVLRVRRGHHGREVGVARRVRLGRRRVVIVGGGGGPRGAV